MTVRRRRMQGESEHEKKRNNLRFKEKEDEKGRTSWNAIFSSWLHNIQKNRIKIKCMYPTGPSDERAKHPTLTKISVSNVAYRMSTGDKRASKPKNFRNACGQYFFSTFPNTVI